MIKHCIGIFLFCLIKIKPKDIHISVYSLSKHFTCDAYTGRRQALARSLFMHSNIKKKKLTYMFKI